MGNPEHVFICSAICSWLWNNHVPILGHKRDCKNVELLSGDAAASLTSDTLRGKTLRHQLKLQVPRAEIDKFITQIKGFREASTQRGGRIPRRVGSRSGARSEVHPAGMPEPQLFWNAKGRGFMSPCGVTLECTGVATTRCVDIHAHTRAHTLPQSDKEEKHTQGRQACCKHAKRTALVRDGGRKRARGQSCKQATLRCGRGEHGQPSPSGSTPVPPAFGPSVSRSSSDT